MLMKKRCTECLMGRIEFECRLATDDEALIRSAVEGCLSRLDGKIGSKEPAPEISSALHRHACMVVGDPDPYRHIKEANNSQALSMEGVVSSSLHTFRDLCLAAVIGNTLDYGSIEHHVADDFSGYFRSEFSKGFTVEDLDEIEGLGGNIVYLCDNAGEIVFDRLLIRHLKDMNARVVVVVRAAPIINDATMKDALEIGLDRIADKVLTNTTGIAELGLNLSVVPDELMEEIAKADIIISKGMANYESLSEMKKSVELPPVAFLMMVKCEPIAEEIGIPKGSRIAYLVR